MVDKEIKTILEILRQRLWTIGVMESCTGGAVANSLTNIPGSSDVFKEGIVTYSNESKIRAGVDQKMIEKYGVYSKETAEEMAKKIGGDVGIGITGHLPGEVFVAVRVREKIEEKKIITESFLKDEIEARKEMKKEVVEEVIKIMKTMIL